MPIIKLTQSMIAQLHCPEGKKRIEYCDIDLPGLYVLASNAGVVTTYFYRYKDDTGKTTHVKVGRTTDVDLAQARQAVKKLRAEIALGANPRAEDKAKKNILTFSQFFEEHYQPYKEKRKRTYLQDVELFRVRLKGEFGHLRLNQITRQQAQLFHTKLLDGGLAPASCDHVIKLLRHALNLSVEWEMLDKNPISGIKLFDIQNQINHYLESDDLEKLLNVLRTDENRTICLIAMCLLSTGCRLNEILTAKWEDVNIKERVFRIAAINSKNKRIRSVPLNDAALDVLRQLDTAGKFDYLFINRQTNKPYTSVHNVWDRLRRKAGLPHLRIHDLRHQYASFLVNSGRTLYEVQQILGHSSPVVTQRYAHLSSKSLQDAANTASVIINAAKTA